MSQTVDRNSVSSATSGKVLNIILLVVTAIIAWGRRDRTLRLIGR